VDEKNAAKQALKVIHLRIKRLRSLPIKEQEEEESPDVIEVNEEDTSESDFDAYVESLEISPDGSNAGADSQATDEVLELTQLDAALAKCKELGRAKHCNVWDIISQYTVSRYNKTCS